MEDRHNFGAGYDKALTCWFEDFSKNRHAISHLYDKFFRIGKYYMLSCAGAFSAHENQLWQIVFSRKGVGTGYASVR